MAKQFDSLDDRHKEFIAAQHLFFVATADESGRVNLSPKGGDSLRVLSPTRLVWRNLTGSGNETAGHLARVNRMTVMWCSFGKRPLILRAYGQARTVHPRDHDWHDLNRQFPPHIGARQVYDLTVGIVQASCGYQVPFMSFEGERDTLDKWTQDRGPDGISGYWDERNRKTIDGLPTGILPE
ncbi:pyridoxamine 5'-phosphate oxidase family protein [Sedimentitalea sp. XS_ASV28]|uniref:pyridoxamine 5'-phosphate oxidase family protein n=1 Tax=Sedimentitalea sp. XS_ASV28 TaxID=3241296 RepID=UPI003514DCAC